MQPVAVSWQSAVQCDWTTKTPTGQCLLQTKQRLAASVYSPLTLRLLHAANAYDRWSVLMRSSWMISHVPSGWVMRKYSSDRRCNPAWFIKTIYVCTSLRQCACWYSMQMFLVSRTSVLRISSVAMHCYARSATHDTWSGLIHFSPICLFVRWLQCRLLVRNWIDLMKGGFSIQFESSRLGWWALGMVSPAHLFHSSCPRVWFDNGQALIKSKMIRF